MNLEWNHLAYLHEFRCEICGAPVTIDVIEGTSVAVVACCDHAERAIREYLIGVEPDIENGAPRVVVRTYVRSNIASAMSNSNRDTTTQNGGHQMSNVEAAKTDKPDKDKTVTIIVNGQPKQVAAKRLSFEELANLAFDGNPPSGPNIVITITYSKGEDGEQGSLLPSKSVRVKDGMVFNVTATDKS